MENPQNIETLVEEGAENLARLRYSTFITPDNTAFTLIDDILVYEGKEIRIIRIYAISKTDAEKYRDPALIFGKLTDGTIATVEPGPNTRLLFESRTEDSLVLAINVSEIQAVH
jgi:hypothetical protein